MRLPYSKDVPGPSSTHIRLHFFFFNSCKGTKLLYSYIIIWLFVITLTYLREDAAGGAWLAAGDVLDIFGVNGYEGRYLLWQIRHGRPWHLDTGV